VSYRATHDSLSFWIHVTPGSRSEAIGGAHGDALRVRVTAQPVGGEANRACTALLARAFETHRAWIRLDPDSKGRRKRVRIQGDAPTLVRRLSDLATGGGTP
jgi:uncharacterized protein YggU (UPF0235/DUF167 family)